MKKVKEMFYEVRLIFKSAPFFIVSLFVASVIAMNLLANKSIDTGLSWLALDCGIIVSWVAFLCMDILTKRFGPKAANVISIFAITVNLFMSLIFFAASKINGTWGQYYDLNQNEVVNVALNGTFASSWYVVLGSTAAFVASALINNFLNYGIGKLLKSNDGFCSYALRSYVSTAIAQFADNLLFAFIVSYNFFGWTVVQCLTCAATGMVAELLCEAIFSPLGFAVCRRWQRENVGKEYLDYIGERK